MSSFDANTFMDVNVTGASEVDYTPTPAGDWPAFIKDLKVREVTNKQSGDTQLVADVQWLITDERAKRTEDDEPQAKQSLWLDVDENGALSFGTNKNVQLGRLREVCGQNDPSQPWNFRLLIGQGPFTVKVEHSDDGKYANVVAVTKMAA